VDSRHPLVVAAVTRGYFWGVKTVLPH